VILGVRPRASRRVERILHHRQPVLLILEQEIHLTRMPVFLQVKPEIGKHPHRETRRKFRRELRVPALMLMQEKLGQLLPVAFGFRVIRPLILSISGSTACSSTE
jgi:hypothetical protein